MSVVTTARCRISQGFIALGRKTRSMPTQTVEQGPEALFLLPQLLRSHRLRKPLVVMGSGQPWGEKICTLLGENDIEYAVWDSVSAFPTADEGENIRLYWLGEGCDSIIALGDGTLLDIAKAAAARASGRNRSIMDMVGRDRVPHRRRVPPVIAIPTVGGSCAESLAAATVFDARGNDFLLEDKALVPPYVILDPALLENVSREDIAAAGINGLCYSVEAYLSGYSDEQTRTVAAKAVSGFLSSVEACWNNGGTPEYRITLLEASQLGGTAASRGGTGYVRALCRSTALVTGKAFSDVCGAMLPLVLENYGTAGAEKLGELAKLAGVSDAGTQAERAEALIERIQAMAFRTGLPERLEGLDEQSILEICDLAVAETNPRCASPVVWTAQQCAQMLMKHV
jgi:alcohol dehydrogenase class IV